MCFPEEKINNRFRLFPSEKACESGFYSTDKDKDMLSEVGQLIFTPHQFSRHKGMGHDMIMGSWDP